MAFDPSAVLQLYNNPGYARSNPVPVEQRLPGISQPVISEITTVPTSTVPELPTLPSLTPLPSLPPLVRSPSTVTDLLPPLIPTRQVIQPPVSSLPTLPPLDIKFALPALDTGARDSASGLLPPLGQTALAPLTTLSPQNLTLALSLPTVTLPRAAPARLAVETFELPPLIVDEPDERPRGKPSVNLAAEVYKMPGVTIVGTVPLLFGSNANSDRWVTETDQQYNDRMTGIDRIKRITTSAPGSLPVRIYTDNDAISVSNIINQKMRYQDGYQPGIENLLLRVLTQSQGVK